MGYTNAQLMEMVAELEIENIGLKAKVESLTSQVIGFLTAEREKQLKELDSELKKGER